MGNKSASLYLHMDRWVNTSGTCSAECVLLCLDCILLWRGPPTGLTRRKFWTNSIECERLSGLVKRDLLEQVENWNAYARYSQLHLIAAARFRILFVFSDFYYYPLPPTIIAIRILPKSRLWTVTLLSWNPNWLAKMNIYFVAYVTTVWIDEWFIMTQKKGRSQYGKCEIPVTLGKDGEIYEAGRKTSVMRRPRADIDGHYWDRPWNLFGGTHAIKKNNEGSVYNETWRANFRQKSNHI